MENAVSNVEEIQTLMFQPSQKKKSTENNEQVPPSQEQTTPNPHNELLALIPWFLLCLSQLRTVRNKFGFLPFFISPNRAVRSLMASIAAFTFTVQRIVDRLAWVDDIAMQNLVHITAHIDDGDELFTSVGFFIPAEAREQFKTDGTVYNAPETPLRVMAYHTGGANRPPTIVNRGMTIELLWDGQDPLAGQDYYIDSSNRRWGRPPAAAAKQQVSSDAVDVAPFKW